MANDKSTKKPLSASAINALKAGGSLSDIGEYSGLNISCQQSGVKTYFYCYRSHWLSFTQPNGVGENSITSPLSSKSRA